MKITSLLLLVLVVLMPFTSYALFYWYTNETEHIFQEYPIESYIRFIEKSEDIKELKEQFIKTINANRDSEIETIELNQEFTELLLAIAMANVLFLFLLVRGLINNASNK